MPFLCYLLSLGGTEWAAVFRIQGVGSEGRAGERRFGSRGGRWEGRMQPMGGCSPAALQPFCGWFWGWNWHFVLTMLWLVITPRGMKGKQGRRLPGSPAPMLHGSGADHDASMRCLPIPQPTAACQPHHPCFQKPPKNSTGRTAALEHHCAQKEGESFKHHHGPKSF